MAWAEPRGSRFRGRYRDPLGIDRTAGWSTSKRAAKKMAEDEEAKIRSGRWQNPDSGKMTFGLYFNEHWLPNRISEANTSKTYRSHYNTSLGPAFGEMQLNQITGPLVQRWLNQMLKAGVSAGTAVARFKALQTVLAARTGVSAVRDGLIRDNPCQGTTLPKVPKRKVDVYSVEEVDALMAEIPEWWHTLVLLAADCGRRWGEVNGLNVSDFGEDFTSFRLERVLLEVSLAVTGNNTPFMIKDRTKGGDSPTLSITLEVASAIKAMVRERQLFPADRLFSMPGKNGLPLRPKEWPTGKPVSRNYFRDYVWTPAHEATGVKQRRFHDLRGAHISWLLAGGADITAVMERVGHKQISTTQLYIDPLVDSNQRSLRALEVTRSRARALSAD